MKAYSTPTSTAPSAPPLAAQAEHADHHGQQQHVEQVQQRAQQPGVGAQLALPRAVVRLVEAGEALAETRRGIARLQHRPCRRWISAIWALRSLRSSRLRTTAGPDSRWYSATISATAGTSAATTSISRQSSHSIATVVPAQHDQAVEHHEQHLHVQRLHRLGVVGDAADQLAGDGAVEEAHRQAQHVAVHLLANRAARSASPRPASRTSCR